MLNLGGPGWFSDVFTLEASYDTKLQGTVTGLLTTEQAPLFDGHGIIRGKLKVSAPSGHKVFQSGISVRMDASVSFYDTLRTLELSSVEKEIFGEGYMEGDKEIPFELDLSEHVMNDTFSGYSFSLRHVLCFTLKRPWYTFDVMMLDSVVIQNVVESLTITNGPGHVLEVPDCGGMCRFDYGKEAFHLGEMIAGTVEFSGLTRPIVLVDVLVLRIESGDEDNCEVVVAEHCVLRVPGTMPVTGSMAHRDVEEARKARKMEALADLITDGEQDGGMVVAPADAVDEEETNSDIPGVGGGQPIIGAGTVPVALKLDAYDVTPTYTDIQPVDFDEAQPDEADQVNVKYHLRLRVMDDQMNCFWNTNEVFLYRNALKGDDDEGGEVKAAPGGTLAAGGSWEGLLPGDGGAVAATGGVTGSSSISTESVDDSES